MAPPRELTVAGIDAATTDVAVAVTRGGELVREHWIAPEPGERPRHARELLPRLADAVDAAGGWAGVDLIGVGIGPGSFTGLRIGVATARALAQGLSKPIAPVVSLRALAAGAPDGERPCLALIDARRGQVFGGLYSASGAELWPPFVAAPGDAAARLAEIDPRPLAVGDGSIRFRKEFEAAGAEVPHDGDEAHRLRARWICALAEQVTPARPEAIEPIYLRPPDAEVWRQRQRSSERGRR
jgi:tRNA threonylcarbamoyladenosine biosynthesis protein TsaB